MPSEFELLDWIAQQPQEFAKTVRCGIGDDCALLETEGTLAVTTDSLVEGVHFRREWMSPWLLGRKALRVGLSDLAAMGACPLGCVLALSLPPELGECYLKAVVGGLLADAARWNLALLGGDLTRCDLIHVNVTVWGRPSGQSAVRRSTARAGDLVLVIGRLGRARLGLQLLESRPSRRRYGVAPTQRFPPARGPVPAQLPAGTVVAETPAGSRRLVGRACTGDSLDRCQRRLGVRSGAPGPAKRLASCPGAVASGVPWGRLPIPEQGRCAEWR